VIDDPDDFLEIAFNELLSDYPLGDLPPVEVKTDKFRAVAQNFFTMPIQLLMDLKAAQLDGDGSDILILFDACEMAFSEEDFDRLADLNIKDFIDVVHAWVNWNQKSQWGSISPASSVGCCRRMPCAGTVIEGRNASGIGSAIKTLHENTRRPPCTVRLIANNGSF